MSNLALSLLATSSQSTGKQSIVMETIMKPLSLARRGARWLLAAGIAVAMLSPLQGFAEDLAPAKTKPADAVTVIPDTKLDFDNPRIVNPEPGRIVPFFTKKG
ncbi:MAG: hypothetical protein E5W69_08270, partial [Mesorhizobium sp.]